MKCSLRWLTLAVCFTSIVAGCKKDESVNTPPASDTSGKPPSPEHVDQAPADPGAAPASTGGSSVIATAKMTPEDLASYEGWFKKHNLDLKDPAMLEADPDGDGYTNREEFVANSDPHDPNAKPLRTASPGIHTAIRLKEYTEVLLPFSLEGIQGEKATLKPIGDGKAVTVKQGDGIKGHPTLKVIRVEKKEDAVDKSGERYDASQVEFEDTATKEKMILVKDHPTRLPSTAASLVSPDGKTLKIVHRGEVFTWPGEGGGRYKVIELGRDQAVLLNMDNNTTWTIQPEAPRP